MLEDTAGKLVLLQSLDSADILIKRPENESLRNDLRQLQRQVRSQGDAAQVEEDESKEPDVPPTGPRPPGSGGGGK